MKNVLYLKMSICFTQRLSQETAIASLEEYQSREEK